MHIKLSFTRDTSSGMQVSTNCSLAMARLSLYTDVKGCITTALHLTCDHVWVSKALRTYILAISILLILRSINGQSASFRCPSVWTVCGYTERLAQNLIKRYRKDQSIQADTSPSPRLASKLNQQHWLGAGLNRLKLPDLSRDQNTVP